MKDLKNSEKLYDSVETIINKKIIVIENRNPKKIPLDLA